MAPLDGQLGNFSKPAQHYLHNRAVWGSCNFSAHDEGYRFLLPGADLYSYKLGLKLTPAQLAERYPVFTVQLPIADSSPAAITAICPDCRAIGERFDLRGRHNGTELKEMFLGGKLFQLLFVKEFLVESPKAPRDAVQRWREDECR
jgi:hypothetical protein